MHKYYEVHQKRVWEVYAANESDAIGLAMDAVGVLNEEEFFIDKVSGVLDE